MFDLPNIASVQPENAAAGAAGKSASASAAPAADPIFATIRRLCAAEARHMAADIACDHMRGGHDARATAKADALRAPTVAELRADEDYFFSTVPFTLADIRAGLAVELVAGVPAVATATQEADPVLATIAEWRELKRLANAAGEDVERVERDHLAETAAVSARSLEERLAVERRLGIAAAKERAEDQEIAELQCSDRVLEMEPVTAEGAFALLEFTAFWVEENEGFDFEDERATAPARAIRAALAVLASGKRFAPINFQLG
ncbi:MAG: hypothetical protein C3F11_08915 [Methylocystaceae bacterium]|nr:MAG: hypothetical protein C3F11_08915 [Methylocystaceae bacterium]